MPNTERLLRLLAWAEGEHEKQQRGEPSEWDQGMWLTRRPDLDCGTACCIAGKVALEDGLVPFGNTRLWEAEHGRETTSLVGKEGTPLGEAIGADEYAQAVLDLTEEQADELFEGGNRITDLRRIIGELVQ